MRFGSKRCSLSDQRARPIPLLDCGTVPTTLNGSGEAPYAGLVGPDPKEERFFDIFTRHAHLAHNAVSDESFAGAVFRDFYKGGTPKPSLANAVIAIRALGIQARYDLFHHRINVRYKGQSNAIREGLLTDDTVSGTRSLINNTYEIDCGDANTLAAIKEIAQDNAYDPVLDLLNECQGKWDRENRLDTWVIRYLGCEDTPLNRAIGRKVLIAGCRRAREPGCKFDTITVLEGVEGTNKSTAIRVLAGDENFSDQSILGASDKEVQEQLDGIWMHENADLAGMKRAEIEHVKAFASRQRDRARPAYGRVREDRPRRSVEWGTTNNEKYLLSQTGNRRFWPLKTGKIDLDALTRDREQLLGEAATYEADGESITLDPSLWGTAQQAQEERRVADPWEDILANMPETVEICDAPYRWVTVPIIHNSGDGFERVASADVLTHVLKIPKAQQNSAHAQRLAHAMGHVGWSRHRSGRVTINGVPTRGYIRSIHRPSSHHQLSGKVTGRLAECPWSASPMGASGAILLPSRRESLH
jgi:predicted P-loop ATPase